MDDTSIDSLKAKILNLEMSLDSIKASQTLSEIQFELNKQQDIISRVNEYYDSAWLKLLIVISILGVILPIIAQYFQRQNLKDLTNFIGNEMKDGFDAKLKQLKELNEFQINSAIQEYRDKLKSIETANENTLKELDASTYFLQGRSSLQDKRYYSAIFSFLRSADLWLKSNRPERSKIQFVNLKLCLKQLKGKNAIANIDRYLEKTTYDKNFEEIIEYFSESDLKHYYENTLKDVLLEIERIKNIT